MFSPVIFSAWLYRLYYSERMTRCLVVLPGSCARAINGIYRLLFSAAFHIDRYAAFAFCGFDRQLTAEYFSQERDRLENLVITNKTLREKLLAEYRQKPRVKLGDLTVIRTLARLPLAERLISRIRKSSLFKK